jgi:hypothetical protein
LLLDVAGNLTLEQNDFSTAQAPFAGISGDVARNSQNAFHHELTGRNNRVDIDFRPASTANLFFAK